ncbi:Polycomb group protein EMBRYONIC FLOWER 2 [Dendrobium catenatum]|uniref:Polycomb group protein EMBRYONIC FLOWER 2 n=1 Tax=Dendrobium catenatum TaxID=906689 RepID=A0A2I0W990_9ASPA|nr:Polycomb group protein EMBRYONIC FLOWER 2 [Dendrobium catenatum]
MNSGQQQRNLFPMYVILVRPIANISIGEQAAVYGVCRSHILSSFYEYGRKDTEVTFVIPEIRKLSTARGANLNMVIVSIGEAQGTSDENHLPEGGEYLNTFPGNIIFTDD